MQLIHLNPSLLPSLAPMAGCGGACGNAVFDEAIFSAQASLQRVYPTAELHYVYILRAKKHIILRNYIEFEI